MGTEKDLDRMFYDMGVPDIHGVTERPDEGEEARRPGRDPLPEQAFPALRGNKDHQQARITEIERRISDGPCERAFFRQNAKGRNEQKAKEEEQSTMPGNRSEDLRTEMVPVAQQHSHKQTIDPK